MSVMSKAMFPNTTLDDFIKHCFQYWICLKCNLPWNDFLSCDRGGVSNKECPCKVLFLVLEWFDEGSSETMSGGDSRDMSISDEDVLRWLWDSVGDTGLCVSLKMSTSSSGLEHRTTAATAAAELFWFSEKDFETKWAKPSMSIQPGSYQVSRCPSLGRHSTAEGEGLSRVSDRVKRWWEVSVKDTKREQLSVKLSVVVLLSWSFVVLIWHCAVTEWQDS